MNWLELLAEKIGALFNGVAIAALSAMLLVVAADIVGVKILNRPFPGAMDVLSLLGVLIIGFSTARTYAKGRHIKVTFISLLLPPRIRKVVRLLSIVLCLVLFVVAIWRLLLYGWDLQTYGESSMTVNIPLAPFVYSLGIAFIPVTLFLFVHLIRIWKGQAD